MDADTAKKLREPFPAEIIGKLPKPTCKACSDNKRDKHCDRHSRQQCRVCGNYITTAHIHLDYVGHAAITDRLLAVDPGWSWEPVAFGPDGLPVLDGMGGLWIRLTVAGVTRLGYGDADGKAGPAAVKEAIGDALRNAAMRFGVGLDLWHKDGQLAHDDEPAPAQQQPRNGTQQLPQAEPQPSAADRARDALRAHCAEHGYDLARVAARFEAQYGEPLRAAADAARISAFTKLLDVVPADELGAGAPATNGAAR